MRRGMPIRYVAPGESGLGEDMWTFNRRVHGRKRRFSPGKEREIALEAIELRGKGVKAAVYKVAAKYGVSHKSVYNWIKRKQGQAG